MSTNNKININFFSKLAEKHGNDIKSVNWGSKITQELRFNKLLEIGDLHQSSILDIGCGVGDLLKYCQALEYEVNYNGIDITPKMIQLCHEKFPFNKNQFQCKDILTLENGSMQYDWVLSSGIFYLLKDNPFETALNLINKMYSFSKKGLAFNSLSSWAKIKEEDEFYMDPLALIERLKNKYTNIVLLHNYHPTDFTIYIYK